MIGIPFFIPIDRDSLFHPFRTRVSARPGGRKGLERLILANRARNTLGGQSIRTAVSRFFLTVGVCSFIRRGWRRRNAAVKELPAKQSSPRKVAEPVPRVQGFCPALLARGLMCVCLYHPRHLHRLCIFPQRKFRAVFLSKLGPVLSLFPRGRSGRQFLRQRLQAFHDHTFADSRLQMAVEKVVEVTIGRGLSTQLTTARVGNSLFHPFRTRPNARPGVGGGADPF